MKLNPIWGPVLSNNGPLFPQGVHREGKANGEGVPGGRSDGGAPGEGLTWTKGSYGGPGTTLEAWPDPHEDRNLWDGAVSPNWLPWRQEEGCVCVSVYACACMHICVLRFISNLLPMFAPEMPPAGGQTSPIPLSEGKEKSVLHF